MVSDTKPTIRFDIFIAGDLATAKQVCRSYCAAGLCVTIEPVDFVYTGGYCVICSTSTHTPS